MDAFLFALKVIGLVFVVSFLFVLLWHLVYSGHGWKDD